jgi:hypothetical protein
MPDGCRAWTDETFTMLPPRSTSSGSAARHARTAENRLNSNIDCQPSSVSPRNPNSGILVPGGGPPALLTRMSSPPNASTARAITSAGASGSMRSAGT